MKKTILLFLLPVGLVFMFTRCTDDEPLPGLGSPFTIDYGEKVQLTDGLSIRFEEVTTDSRCPCEAECITAGQIGVKLKITTNDTELLKLFTLAGYDDLEGAVTKTRFDGYLIELKDVLPYPCNGQPDKPEDYKVEVLVK
ncbi:MAG TPA: hypothetical protein ENJ20_07625 [Bacteroidetes bacterium]|nr:hypothetical protein [Bacteroidota bacterium]